MMRRFAVVMAFGGLLALASPAAAQGRGRKVDDVPPGHRPPPGMCRIWIDGVPAGQQPAPTDCATAVRNRPSNGRVIFGDDYARPERHDAPRFDEGQRGEPLVAPRKDRKDERKGHEDDGHGRKPPACIDRNHDGRCEAVPEKHPPSDESALIGAFRSRRP